MKKWAYYNEIDPFAAEWIRKLMAAKIIMQGEVDANEKLVKQLKDDTD